MTRLLHLEKALEMNHNCKYSIGPSSFIDEVIREMCLIGERKNT